MHPPEAPPRWTWLTGWLPAAPGGRGKQASATRVNASVGSSLWHLKSLALPSLLEGENREGRLWYCITLSVTGKQFFRSSVKSFLGNEKWAWTPGHLKRYLLWNVKAAEPTSSRDRRSTWDPQAKSGEAGSRNLSINEIWPQNHHSKQQPGRKEHTCGRRGSQSPGPWKAGRDEASLVSSARCEETGGLIRYSANWRWQLKCLVAWSLLWNTPEKKC